jgi:hypothetical protein
MVAETFGEERLLTLLHECMEEHTLSELVLFLANGDEQSFTFHPMGDRDDE